MDEIDHLTEAKHHVIATPQNPRDHFLRAQAHALIAIAEWVRTPPIRYVMGDDEGLF